MTYPTEEQIEAWAAEAEAGYDVDEIIRRQASRIFIVKIDQPSAGKGVLVTQDVDEAVSFVRDVLLYRGRPGKRVSVEIAYPPKT